MVNMLAQPDSDGGRSLNLCTFFGPIGLRELFFRLPMSPAR